MATFEMTWADRSVLASSRLRDDLTESDRLVNVRAEASRPVFIERIVSRIGRGKTITFKYQDGGNPLPIWFDPVLQGFANLVALPDNWDGEGAARIDTQTVNQALAAIDLLLPSDAPAPNVVPTSDSGLQIEWHRRHKDLEVEFRPNGPTEFYYFDEASGEEHEGPVGPSFVHLREYLGRIW